jgi:hypothetical protein
MPCQPLEQETLPDIGGRHAGFQRGFNDEQHLGEHNREISQLIKRQHRLKQRTRTLLVAPGCSYGNREAHHRLLLAHCGLCVRGHPRSCINVSAFLEREKRLRDVAGLV